MKAKYLAAVLFLVIGAVLINFSCSKDSYSSSNTNNDNRFHNISIQSTGYMPASVTLMAGGIVKWTNNDVVAHTVTSNDGTSFNSGSIAAGGNYSHSFTTTGTYNYHCSSHPEMTGVVMVNVNSSNY